MSTRVLPEFRLIVPSTLDEAVDVIVKYRANAQIIAGGTDVLVSMKNASASPGTLIKIGRLEDLDFMTYSDENGLAIGPLTTIHAIESSALMNRLFPLMVDAANMFANVQTLNMATLGGNVCNASPAGDMLPPLQSMNAEIDLLSSAGKRTVRLVNFYTGPGKCVMEPGEIVVAINAPALPAEYGSSFVKFSRTAEDLAKVSAAVVLTEKDGKFKDVRISLGAVAPTPIRVSEAEEYLENQQVCDSVIEEAAAIARSAISPISDLRSTADYRKEITGIAVKRAIAQALDRRNAQ